HAPRHHGQPPRAALCRRQLGRAPAGDQPRHRRDHHPPALPPDDRGGTGLHPGFDPGSRRRRRRLRIAGEQQRGESTSMAPKVTFVVPCYKLAHLLPECVNSILAQTYRDFEILIMDDCSPDDTPQVARSFSGDPRVQYIRNDPNLGHLRNYNKGLKMARGEYVWLMSADDRLRSPHILERYVKVMEENPQVGYAF